MQQIESPASRQPSRLTLTLGILIGAIVLLVAALAIGSGGAGPGARPQTAGLILLVPAAFVAGLLSFLSPCTLPILPAYFAFSFQAQRQNVVMMTITFFLGLATTVTVLGATASALSQLLFDYLPILTQLGGVVIIGFGLMSALGKGFAGLQIQDRPSATVIGSYLYGATFALGWTACVGPILGAILTLLATQGGGVAQGGLLAFVYALGLGAPLIVISAFFSRLGHGTGFWRFIKGRGFTVRLGSLTLDLHSTSLVSGGLLIAMGLLLASGQLTLLAQWASASDLNVWVLRLEEQLQVWLGLN